MFIASLLRKKNTLSAQEFFANTRKKKVEIPERRPQDTCSWTTSIISFSMKSSTSVPEC